MKKYYVSLLLAVIMALSCAGCQNARNSATNTNNENYQEDENADNQEISDQNNGATENEDTNTDVTDETGETDETQGNETNNSDEVVQELPEWVPYSDLPYDEAKWLETVFADTTTYFADYNGETLHRIPEQDEFTDPASRGDIIYYKTQETDMQTIINVMADSMIKPLMESSEERSYTITAYKFKEHTLHQVNDNVWLIDYINGYYKFEGVDLVDMETLMEYESSLMDEEGYFPFQRDGSEGVFVYALVKNGDIYRLQRLDDMYTMYQSQE